MGILCNLKSSPTLPDVFPSDSTSDNDNNNNNKSNGPPFTPFISPILRRHTWPASNTRPSLPIRSVHFDAGEHVRYFWKAEQPIAVGITASPPDEGTGSAVVGVQLALARLNFSAEREAHHDEVGNPRPPVELERVWLADCPIRILASVVVANWGFEKDVVCRFTWDGWRTSNDVGGVYLGSIGNGFDRFIVPVYHLDASEDPAGRIFELCFRYYVNRETYWDNNGGRNYQVLLHREVVVRSLVRDRALVTKTPAREC